MSAGPVTTPTPTTPDAAPERPALPGPWRTVIGRVAVALAQLAAVSVIVFALTTLLPGDAAEVVLGADATEEQIATVRAQLGLDRPPLERFGEWVGGLFQGDLGTSLVTEQPVTTVIAGELGSTAVVAAAAVVVFVPLSVGVGVIAGRRPGSALDRVLTALLVVGQAIPEFALGLVLVAVFSLQLGLLPATAAGGGLEPTLLILPVAVLVIHQLGRVARQIRIGVVDTDRSEHVVHLRRLGLRERAVLWRHVVPGAIVPALQQLARVVDGFVAGVVVVEALFALSGVGSGFVEAVLARDLPMVQGYALLFAAITITVNLAADVASARLVPQREALS